MPFVSVDYFTGPGEADRRRLQAGLAEVVMRAFGAPSTNVRVFTRAFSPEDVYVADGEVGSGLPVIRVEFLPGRTPEQKRELVYGLAHVAADVLGVPKNRVRIILFEKDRSDWARGDRLVSDTD